MKSGTKLHSPKEYGLQLKYCPFCGKDNLSIAEREMEGKSCYAVVCECGATVEHKGFAEPKHAVAFWNRRTNRDILPWSAKYACKKLLQELEQASPQSDIQVKNFIAEQRGKYDV